MPTAHDYALWYWMQEVFFNILFYVGSACLALCVIAGFWGMRK